MLPGETLQAKILAARRAASAHRRRQRINTNVAHRNAPKPHKRFAANTAITRKQGASYRVHRTSQHPHHRTPNRNIRYWNAVAPLFLQTAEDAPRLRSRPVATPVVAASISQSHCTAPDAISRHAKKLTPRSLALLTSHFPPVFAPTAWQFHSLKTPCRFFRQRPTCVLSGPRTNQTPRR